jgi:hypothetical protein
MKLLTVLIFTCGVLFAPISFASNCADVGGTADKTEVCE